jgi:hypothetical protein
LYSNAAILIAIHRTLANRAFAPPDCSFSDRNSLLHAAVIPHAANVAEQLEAGNFNWIAYRIGIRYSGIYHRLSAF